MIVVPAAQIEQHAHSGPWRGLERIAQHATQAAAALSASPFVPVLGGGTRLMLAIRHRISDDIDLFIDSPQWLGYLTPRLQEDLIPDYVALEGYDEAAASLKLRFEQGEIGFVCALRLTDVSPTTNGQAAFPLDSVAEVLAKKLFHRGWALTPRDLYDWWAIDRAGVLEVDKAALFALLPADRLRAIQASLDALARSASAAKVWDSLRALERPPLAEVVKWGLDELVKAQA